MLLEFPTLVDAWTSGSPATLLYPASVSSITELLENLAGEPNARGRQFEHICTWFFSTDPVYRAELRRIWLWNEWPGRWAADAGIDLVAEARDGGLWAIQAKAYDPRYSIKKSDVDTFLSESARPEFSFRLLVTTTNEIGATAKRTLEARQLTLGCDSVVESPAFVM
jgi:predicted helicase